MLDIGEDKMAIDKNGVPLNVDNTVDIEVRDMRYIQVQPDKIEKPELDAPSFPVYPDDGGISILHGVVRDISGEMVLLEIQGTPFERISMHGNLVIKTAGI